MACLIDCRVYVTEDQEKFEAVEATEFCKVCGVQKGFQHKAGCREEDCPRCGNKLVMCLCHWAI